ncbi:uncharacterized protein LOC125507190 [Triticum urartu]|uniref:uncharacterized protein LOC125507177 n=1 Tax=Triticum urartu TaxID=4572 RepID=UPI002043F082|nr:uncharacterized protein LOC125507177 [Triticum urartu]XP_048527808.1 uncharacterized protein LOC125507190 [Triticum urartu]
MTVTWTSGYGISEAHPFVEWGMKGSHPVHAAADTVTFGRESLCGEPARSVGWRDPGFIHTAFLKNLSPEKQYYYKIAHTLHDGKVIWGKPKSFGAPPYPGQKSTAEGCYEVGKLPIYSLIIKVVQEHQKMYTMLKIAMMYMMKMYIFSIKMMKTYMMLKIAMIDAQEHQKIRKGSQATTVAIAIAKEHKLSKLEDARKLVKDNMDEERVQAVVTGVTPLRSGHYMMELLDMKCWEIQNKYKLYLLNHVTNTLYDMLNLTTPSYARTRRAPITRNTFLDMSSVSYNLLRDNRYVRNAIESDCSFSVPAKLLT